MTALKPAEINAFLKKPPATLEAVLIYGPDAGLVSERAKSLSGALAKLEDPEGEILALDDADLTADPDRLAVELQMMPMFGGRKVIRLRAGARLNPKTLEDLLSDGPLESRLVVEAGDLKKGAKLRTLFEKSKSAYAIPCYADDARSLGDLIRTTFDETGQRIDRDAVAHLQSLLGADRNMTRSELQKLALYTEGKATVTIEDIDAIIGDSATLALDTICYAVTGANNREAMKQFDRAVAAGHAPQAITAALSRHIMSLFHVRAAMDSGDAMDNAMRKLRPPIFYKRQTEFQSQCRRWTSDGLTKALSLVQETLVRCRTSPDLERAYTERLLMSVSRLGH